MRPRRISGIGGCGRGVPPPPKTELFVSGLFRRPPPFFCPALLSSKFEVFTTFHPVSPFPHPTLLPGKGFGFLFLVRSMKVKCTRTLCKKTSSSQSQILNSICQTTVNEQPKKKEKQPRNGARKCIQPSSYPHFLLLLSSLFHSVFQASPAAPYNR